MTDFNNSDNPPEPDQIDMMDGNELKENLRQEIDKNFRERQKMLDELARDAFNHFKGQEIINEMRIKDYIEQWKPRGMI